MAIDTIFQTGQFRRAFTLCACALLLGCAIPGPIGYMQPSASVVQTTGGSADSVCSFESAHYRADDSLAPAGYYCPVSTSSALGTCTYVAAYSRKDGTAAGPYVRCNSHDEALRYKSAVAASAGADPAPCVTGYCGPVHVKGYYRKDGTYVRPYTRRK
jgi:hypothetical protein